MAALHPRKRQRDDFRQPTRSQTTSRQSPNAPTRPEYEVLTEWLLLFGKKGIA